MKQNQLITMFKTLILSACVLTLMIALNAYGDDTCKNPDINKDRYGLYNCYNNSYFSNESDPNVNKVCVDKTLYWTFFGRPDDTVTVTFSKKYGCLGTAPGDDSLTKKIGADGSASLKLKIKAGKSDNCYYYEITCAPTPYSKGAASKSGDPIIDVPKP